MILRQPIASIGNSTDCTGVMSSYSTMMSLLLDLCAYTHHGYYGIFRVILYSPAVHRTWILEYHVPLRLHDFVFPR